MNEYEVIWDTDDGFDNFYFSSFDKALECYDAGNKHIYENALVGSIEVYHLVDVDGDPDNAEWHLYDAGYIEHLRDVMGLSKDESSQKTSKETKGILL